MVSNHKAFVSTIICIFILLQSIKILLLIKIIRPRSNWDPENKKKIYIFKRPIYLWTDITNVLWIQLDIPNLFTLHFRSKF